MSGTRYEIEVAARLPERLVRLRELANNLWYSWDAHTQALFARIDCHQWLAAGHSPKAFLNRVDQQALDAAADDADFLGNLDRVLSSYDAYHAPRDPRHCAGDAPHMEHGDLIAYFCAEFGFHESLPIYSGGLGILAADHCKTASDLKLPFVGIGLLYRQGYFHQRIDADGRQTASYHDSDFDDLPITPALRADGSPLHVRIDIAERSVDIKVWRVQVGTVSLYLLDTDLDSNAVHDRDIAHQLYGGDRNTRIEQEIVLGTGGVRVLRELGLMPTVWHINEGHAAFMIVERIRQLMQAGLDFPAAVEAVASNTVFTMHTSVPAGQEHFGEEMMRRYFGRTADAIGGIDTLLALGREPGRADFNMAWLAIRGSRHCNGVSRIHGEVSANICAGLWPQIDPAENPVDYVTNGIHIPSFLGDLWHEVFNRHLGPRWQQQVCRTDMWQAVHTIPDHEFWSTRQAIKSQLLHLIRYRLSKQQSASLGSQAHLDRLLKHADPDNPNVLTIGFARRFATYKRATLLFHDLDWLRRITTDSRQPVLFIFAGKAHPADEPGQALIRRIAEVAAMPEFESHILLIEGYDLHLGRRLVAGVDVWLNNPLYPLEASGTSGMKAALNGVINLSVLDGWWAEGHDAGKHTANGWGIKPVSPHFDEARRNQEEARALYELLQDSVIPMYYRSTALGYSPEWVAMAKQSIASIMPRYNMQRMLTDYAEKFYSPAAEQWRRYSSADFAGARSVAEWKARVRAAWPKIAIRRLDQSAPRIRYGEAMRFEVAVQLDGLTPGDLAVELVFTRPGEPTSARARRYALKHERALDNGEHLYARELTPDQCGKMEYRVRVYPTHELLTHPFEMGMMLWL
jgi:starch phosphorylase